MSSITLVTTTGQPGDPATITGTGFGAVQGTAVLLFYTAAGVTEVVTPTSWSDTSILAAIPTDADITVPCFFEILFDTSDIAIKGPIVDTVPVTAVQSQPNYFPSDIVVAKADYVQATPGYKAFVDHNYKEAIGIVASYLGGNYTVTYTANVGSPQTVPADKVCKQGVLMQRYYTSYGITPNVGRH